MYILIEQSMPNHQVLSKVFLTAEEAATEFDKAVKKLSEYKEEKPAEIKHKPIDCFEGWSDGAFVVVHQHTLNI